MKKIRILFVLISLVTGGAERVAVHLTKYLDREKFDIALCLCEKKGNLLSEVPEGIETFDLGKKSRWSFPFLSLHLYKVLKKFRPDIIFSILWYPTVITAITKLVSKNKKLPLFIAYEPHNSKQDIPYEGFKKLKAPLIDYAHNATDLVIVDSYGAASDISQHYKLSPQSIKVIYNSIDIRAIHKLMIERATLPFDGDRLPIITGFGRLIKRKGFDYLIKAFDLVRKQTPCKLLLIGDGEEKQQLEHLVKTLKMEDDVIFLGYQENPYKIISKTDLFVFSSLWEGFGNVIIEAMACGIPIISTRCPWGPEEIITDGVNGLLVPVKDIDALADAMLRLLNDGALRKRLAESGRQRANDFRAEKIAAEYERTFLECMAQKGLRT